MRFTRRNTFWRRLPRRVCAGVSLAAYLVAAVGFPIPAASAAIGGIPFPCQNHACGCQSAEQCWRSCCCFTPEEHWAWAKANHVEPPAYAARPSPSDPPAPKSWNTPRLRDQAEGQAAPAHACAECARKSAAASCCEKKQPTSTAPPGGIPWIAGPSALGCRGLSTLWIASGAVTPPPPSLTWEPYIAAAGWVSSSQERAADLALIPPDPPPRSIHS